MILLGFDVRVPPEEAARAWSAARRASFLLVHDAKTPLSVDPAVWPVFTGGPARTGPWGLAGAELDAPPGGVAIAIAIVDPVGDDGGPWRALASAPPGGVPEGFVALGLDVVDLGGLGVLTNTGIDGAPPAPPEIVQAIDPETHLFVASEAGLAAARRFRASVAGRLPSHGPLGIVCLYRRPEAPRH